MLRATLLRSLVALALLTSVAAAQPGVKKHVAKGKPGADAAAQPEKPFQEWKKVTKDAEKIPGYLTLWKKRENLYLELPKEMLNVPVLGVFSFSRGIGQNFVLGGLPLNDRLIEFQRNGDRVFVIEKNVRFLADEGSPMAKANELSHGHSVLASLKIESEHDSSKAVLVDLAGFLVSDLTDLAENLKFALGNKPVRFDKDRSALGTIKNFPENTEIEALLTYTPNDRNNLSLEAVPDNRYIPIGIHYSFSKLPATPMMPRLADERVGYFLTAKKDFSRDDQENFWRRYVEHWRLEKKDPTAALSEPVKPITFYLDHTIPAAYRPWVKEGIEKWNKAFEAAGFKNAIVGVDAPNDPNWDAEDVRYSTIRWITSHQPAFGAIGPTRVDPRSGEILDADILFEATMIQNYRNGYRRYAGPDAMAAEVLPWMRPSQQLPAWMSRGRLCEAQQGMADGGALQRVAMLVDGSLPPGSPVPDGYLREAIVEVTMHEVGHSLGLRHNFRSSTAVPFDKLHDKAFTEEHGLTGSVMDYPVPNIASDRSKQGNYWTVNVGPYDVWAIRYAYTPSGAGDVDADYAFASKIADESLKPGHEYSTDEDTYPSNALDPRTNIYDLGDDALRFAKDRTAYVSGLWKSGKLEERVVGAEGDLSVLRRAMDTLIGQYGTALGQAVKYVGGQHSTRVRRGQPDAVDPLKPVPAAKQREALDFLAQRAFAADAFGVNPSLLSRLAPDRWSHWGMPDMFGPNAVRLDYDLDAKVLAIQNALLNGLTSPSLLARVREAETRSPDAFKLSEHFDRMTRMMWGEVGAGATPAFKALDGPTTRRAAPRAYVDKLATMVVAPPANAPDDARALARLQLTRIDARAARALAGETPMGDYTRAHLLETRARVKRALEAQREADPARPAGPGAFASPNQN